MVESFLVWKTKDLFENTEKSNFSVTQTKYIIYIRTINESDLVILMKKTLKGFTCVLETKPFLIVCSNIAEKTNQKREENLWIKILTRIVIIDHQENQESVNKNNYIIIFIEKKHRKNYWRKTEKTTIELIRWRKKFLKNESFGIFLGHVPHDDATQTPLSLNLQMIFLNIIWLRLF